MCFLALVILSVLRRVLLFCFYCYGDHRQLRVLTHSCPTRRASGLPIQVSSIRSMDQEEMVFNIVSTAKAAVNYNRPIVHSTVNVQTGANKPPIPEIQEVLGHLDRKSVV